MNRFLDVPASFFGMPLGTIALGIAWQAAVPVWHVPGAIGDTLVVAGTALWAVLVLAYAAKWLWNRAVAKIEWTHPVQCCFVGLAGVVGSLASVGLVHLAQPLSFVLFAAGAAWTIAFAVWRTGGLWQGGRAEETTTPVLYLPSVAGSLVTASAAAAQGLPGWGQLAFGAGVLSWLAIESVLMHRLYTAPAMAPALRPTLGIQLAPPAVAAVAYLNVGGGAPDLVANALFGYAVLQALVAIRLLPWLRAAGATPGWWGFSFASAALPTVALKLVAHGDTGPAATLAPILFVAGNLVIAALVVMTVRLGIEAHERVRLDLVSRQAHA